MQLQHPSQHPTHYKTHANMQYFSPLEQFYIAFPTYPGLQSIQQGAHNVQQQASQKRQANPQASQACQTSIQQATLQAFSQQQQQLQHFLIAYIKIQQKINNQYSPHWHSNFINYLLLHFLRYYNFKFMCWNVIYALCLLNAMFQIVFYKLINIINMSTSQLQLLGQRRTSRRRKIKTQKVLDQYMILNPFKKNSRSSVIPDQLNKQLRKLEYLSNANLEKIKLRKTAEEQNQNLSRMRKASFEQEEKYLSCLKDWPALQTSCSLNFISSNSLKPVSRKPVKSFVTSISHFDVQNLVEDEDSKIEEECGENIEQMNPESNLFSDNYDNKNFFPELQHDAHIDNMQNENQHHLTHVMPNEQYGHNYQIDVLQQGLFNLRTENHEIEETLYYGDYRCQKSKQHQFSYYYH